MSAARVFVPADSAALAVGAGRVAKALDDALAARGLATEIVRTGSRGLFWLEPLVEVETPEGRISYGPVTPADVPPLLDAGLLRGGAHPLRGERRGFSVRDGARVGRAVWACAAGAQGDARPVVVAPDE